VDLQTGELLEVLPDQIGQDTKNFRACGYRGSRPTGEGRPRCAYRMVDISARPEWYESPFDLLVRIEAPQRPGIA
jgi:hypothetical protein